MGGFVAAFRRVCLVFGNADSEAAFLGRRRKTLERSLLKCGAIVMAVCFALWAGLIMSYTSLPNFGNGRVAMMVNNGCLQFMWMFAMTLAKIENGDKYISDRNFERLAVGLLLASTFATYGCDGWYSSKLAGQNPYTSLTGPQGEVPTLSDTRVLMAQANLLTSAHVVMPIRWIWLLPLDLFVVLLYAFCLFTGLSPENSFNGTNNLVLLVALVMGMAIGTRIIEIYEREAMTQFISERVLRVKTEFRLGQLQEQRTAESERAGGQDPENSSLGRTCPKSLPSTTGTDRIFSDGATWESIAGLGLREQWLLSASELHVEPGQSLGEGSFGVVIAAKFHGTMVAVKIPKRSLTVRSDEHLRALLNELRILRHLRHPRVVALIGACVDVQHGDVALVLEMVSGTTLRHFIMASSAGAPLVPPSDADRLQIVADVGSALQYLHSRSPRVVHGDLKDSNIFVSGASGHDGVSIHTKLLDFGLSRVLTSRARPLGGSLRWVAPEVYRGWSAPHPSADVFSFGMLIFFITTSTLPSANRSKKDMMLLLDQGRVAALPWPNNGPLVHRFKATVDNCIQAAPDMRPGIFEVMREPTVEDAYLDALDRVAEGVYEEALHWHEVLQDVRNTRSSWLATLPASGAKVAGPHSAAAATAVAGHAEAAVGLGGANGVQPKSLGWGDVDGLVQASQNLAAESRGMAIDLLKEALKRCNSKDTPISSSCCVFHVIARQLADIFREEFLVMPCRTGSRPHALSQCSVCGALDSRPASERISDGSTCETCSGRDRHVACSAFETAGKVHL